MLRKIGCLLLCILLTVGVCACTESGDGTVTTTVVTTTTTVTTTLSGGTSSVTETAATTTSGDGNNTAFSTTEGAAATTTTVIVRPGQILPTTTTATVSNGATTGKTSATTATTTTTTIPTTTTTIKENVVDKDSVPTAAPTQPPVEEPPVVVGLTPLPRDEYYGYTLLKQANNSTALLAAYNRLVAGVENMDEKIVLQDEKNPVSLEELLMVWYYYQLDYPQHFWLDRMTQCWHDGRQVMYVNMKYLMSEKERDEAKIKFDQAVKTILDGVSGDWSEYRRELTVHDRLCEQNVYQSGSANDHNAYGALVEKRSVCEGYAEAFQYLMYQCGIQCLGVVGSAGGPHKWNIVRIDNQYYQIDVTWDDPIVNGGTIHIVDHAYFNLTDALMGQDHQADSSYGYPLPACNATAAAYRE